MRKQSVMTLEIVPRRKRDGRVVAQKLVELGFRVIVVGEGSISVFAPTRVVQETFHPKVVGSTQRVEIPSSLISFVKEVVIPLPPEYLAKDLENALGIYTTKLMSYPNCVGLVIGTKNIGGYDTREPCLKVYVEKKLSKKSLRAGQCIPRSVIVPSSKSRSGQPVKIKTDVEEIGEIKLERRDHVDN